MLDIKHCRVDKLSKPELSDLKAMMVEFERELGLIARSGFNLQRCVSNRAYIDLWIEQICKMGSTMHASLLSVDGKLVGYACWDVDPTVVENSVEINEVYICRDSRRKGYAFSLIESLMGYAKSVHNLTTFTLEVYSVNLAALGLYKKLGFNVKQPLSLTLYKK